MTKSYEVLEVVESDDCLRTEEKHAIQKKGKKNELTINFMKTKCVVVRKETA